VYILNWKNCKPY